MLVLTRKLQQQIKIGDEITVTVLRVKGNTVRIGVQAPRDVRVVRAELPKHAAEQSEEKETIAEDVTVVCEVAEKTAAASNDACVTTVVPTVADDAPEPVRAAHLPLKRIRERFGNAPLKQVIASCPTLAK